MEFTTFKVAGVDALRRLEEYRAKYPTSRVYPFLIGGAEELEYLEEAAESDGRDPAAIIRASLDVDPAAWIAGRKGQVEDDGVALDDELIGEWPEGEIEKSGIGLHIDLMTGKIKPEVYLGLVTIDEPWQLPAVLNYGGWNDCPFPEVHAAFHRAWFRRYGAEIVGASHDVVECLVARPPQTQDAAMDLAWEQYWYCSDIVDQGCGTIANLAATLLDAPVWYFWWD
ncbi:DUF4253 domain-containing protein [Paludisphaera mucosa]|uniref:DUF4253 domain-containing protein n=1 Tax=Paludisphaera mucosa TaxID=3030827 RepID=A0ABT6FFL8_9BACT|nr:DUF4253 domain-containing protein [Paludisphaera mucosa]MDG3006363.1 DUF4253 domain-containing protein [Paludisphaera mucosa]